MFRPRRCARYRVVLHAARRVGSAIVTSLGSWSSSDYFGDWMGSDYF